MNRRLRHAKTGPGPRRPSRSGASSPFVGRDEELTRLANALTLAAEGQGRTILLVGQPGIGKTCMAQQALTLAKCRGFTVLEGHAYPLEVGLAYMPILDAFGRLLRSLDADRLASVVSGLPHLGLLFDGLSLPAPGLSEVLGDPAFEKTRLFEAMMRLLERLTQQAPVALFIDDLHWAETTTLELLHYLGRSLSDRRALLLATYGAGALDTYPELRRLVVSLRRSGVAEEVIVPRLRPEAVERMVRGILGGEAPSSLLALLEVRAEGTPLFVEALCDALIDSGNLIRSPSEKDGWELNAEGAGALPSSVRDLIMERLDRLSSTERHVLGLVATIDDATPHTLLRTASGLEEEALLDALQHLRAAGLIAQRIAVADVNYGITHPLIQEVAYAELPEKARRRAHLAAIEALERLRANDPSTSSGQLLNRLTCHYREAGFEANPHRALAVLMSAGERALALYANEEAARCFEAALTIVREGCHTPGPTEPPLKNEPLLPCLREQLGEAWERIGRREAAVQMWNQALAERERSGDPVASARVHRLLVRAEWNRGRFEIAKAHLRAGLAALAGREPCQELADLLYAGFNILDRLGDVAGMADTATQLLALAERLPSPQVEADANLIACMFSMELGDVSTARERALHALMVGEQAQAPAVCYRAQSMLVAIGMRLGDHRFMRYYAEHGLAIAQRLGAPYWEILLRHRLAYANFLCGAWNESLRNSTEAIGLARRVGHPRDLAYSLAGRAMILACQGDLSEAAACISEAKIVFGGGTSFDRYVFGLVDTAEAALALEWGQVERALGIASGFVCSPAPAATHAGLTPPYRPIGLMLLAEAQAAAGDGESALETARNLIALGPADAPYLVALASRAEGLGWQALGRGEAALACLARAHEAFNALEMPFEAARALLDQATSLATVRPELAVKAAQQSLEIFQRFGAERYAHRARRFLRESGIAAPATRKTRLGGGFVSARELEIARLVALGMTTSEIAERLGVAPRTVTAHLEHVYDRLGIGSRAALARSIVEAGLL